MNFKGGRIKRSKGYWYIWKPNHPFANKDHYIAEHRLVIEKKIGRYLTKDEIVHHVNHNPEDNRIKNLILLKKTEHYHHEPKWINALKPTQFKKGETRAYRKGHIPWNKGKNLTEKHKEKIRFARLSAKALC